MRSLFVVAGLSMFGGCANNAAHIEIVPVHVIEGAVSSSRLPGSEPAVVGTVRSVREEGVWLYRLTHEPLTHNQVSELVLIEALFCPGRGDDLSKCRSGVLWRAGADPRSQASGAPLASPPAR